MHRRASDDSGVFIPLWRVSEGGIALASRLAALPDQARGPTAHGIHAPIPVDSVEHEHVSTAAAK
ncbi:hypothetical protein Trco_005673 [Trichoderma cornu-damae]|uniref:Uncharacterized protein n=1 Tax=Trichoderma cornu-damae TaxID=654480 RepID=A0A9P8QJF9_9HYPO|nr:hypothetical protein Trco_005673 [Trichoderma cornu-damae]